MLTLFISILVAHLQLSQSLDEVYLALQCLESNPQF